MKIQNKKGFTLIELLVVITIIGILATGATATYTSQIQKARDSTRITSVEALKSGIEQVYQDNSEYPYSSRFYSSVSTYVERFPADPKHSQSCNNNGSATGTVACGYTYRPDNDDNGINFGSYEISTAFENKGNVTSRAMKDAGNDNLRLEMGMRLSSIDTAATTLTKHTGICTPAGGGIAATGADTAIITIMGNPTGTLDNECGAIAS